MRSSRASSSSTGAGGGSGAAGGVDTTGSVTGGAASATYSSSRKGYGPGLPGSLVLPAPDTYRSRFIAADGTYDWRGELEFGFELRALTLPLITLRGQRINLCLQPSA